MNTCTLSRLRLFVKKVDSTSQKRLNKIKGPQTIEKEREGKANTLHGETTCFHFKEREKEGESARIEGSERAGGKAGGGEVSQGVERKIAKKIDSESDRQHTNAREGHRD